ncbi:hypothetical protein LIER_16600 [Lithospermum erythrorhizon]|uniref:Reverse transcriptase zinc-binding domain-containing protein n=1 Tax=Lithospermum erythrorhizon TaxID=34254 RepID=A0AAV3QCN9_LITER
MFTVVYEANLKEERKILWDELKDWIGGMMDKPWMLIGDFNVVLDSDEALGGGPPDLVPVEEFRECMEALKHQFDNPGLSDHSLMVVMINKTELKFGGTFKFQSFWCKHPEYKGVIEECWREEVEAKCRVNWLALEDSSTRYFHQKMRGRYRHIKLLAIGNAEDVILIDRDKIAQEVFRFYEGLFGDSSTCLNEEDRVYASKATLRRLGTQEQNMLSVPTREEEVRSTLFSMADHRAPGPDDFIIEFYKNGWSVVGVDFTKVVREFFATGCMLKGINATAISLIPKKQELVYNYHKMEGSRRCAIKIDIMKVYDSVKWEFLWHTVEDVRCTNGWKWPVGRRGREAVSEVKKFVDELRLEDDWRLETKDRVKKWLPNMNTKCLLYQEEESQGHLFFECEYTKGVWRRVLNMVNLYRGTWAFDRELDWLLKVKVAGRLQGLLLIYMEENVYSARKRRVRDIYFLNMSKLEVCGGVLSMVKLYKGTWAFDRELDWLSKMKVGVLCYDIYGLARRNRRLYGKGSREQAAI